MPERARELTLQIKQRTAEYASSKYRSQLVSHPPNDILNAIAELESLLSERQLTSVREDPSDPGEVESLVGARIKPKPPLNSGSIALPLPGDPDLETPSFPSLELHLVATG